MSMKKNFICYVVLLCCIIATVFTACTTDDDNQTAKPTDAKALVGTWECDLSGRTFALWNYGKSWNVWTFNSDGTGVCDVFFLAGEEPVAIQHQPFTYTAEDGKLVTKMEDGDWEWEYQTIDGKLLISYGDSPMTFDKVDAAKVAQFGEWSKRELLSVPGLQARYTVFVYGNAGGQNG